MDDLHAPTVASGPVSRPPASGMGKKQTLQELSARKENLEAELSALSSVLDSHGVNMNTSLTTFDGYPRADIDVAQIRTTRARIIRLINDHKELMRELEDAVNRQFAAANAGDGQEARQPSQAARTDTASDSSNPPPSTSAPAAIEPPFARVNSVAPDSPADQARMKLGDRVMRFGSVDWTNHDRLRSVAQAVQQNENRAIGVKVLRDGAPVELLLTPRRDWGGRGLLGCHLIPL